MIMRGVLLLSLWLPVTVLANEDVTSVCTRQYVVSDGLQRSALVCVPYPRPAGSLPLVLAFHPRTNPDALINPPLTAAERFRDTKRLHASWPQAVTVYFEGMPGNASIGDVCGNSFSWQFNPGESTVAATGGCTPPHAPIKDRDVNFVSRFVNSAFLAQHNIDMTRIYATGESAGSRFTGVLWFYTSRQPGPLPFAALAFSSVMPGTEADPALPYDGTMKPYNCGAPLNPQTNNLIAGSSPVPVLMSISYMESSAARYQAQLTAVCQMRNAFGIADGGVPLKDGLTVYQDNALRTLIIYNHKGGHSWPMTSLTAPDKTTYESQSKLVMEFFKLHHR